jgi:hypothetical protein
LAAGMGVSYIPGISKRQTNIRVVFRRLGYLVRIRAIATQPIR